MVRRYIVGYDGSPASRAALDFTRALAARTGVGFVAAHVYPSLERLYAAPYGAAVPFATVAGAGDAGLAIAERLLADVASDVEPRAWAGESVPYELHALARAEHAALLAVGATHRGALGRAVLGSTAERIVHGSPCPVLVVPDRDGARAIATIAVAYDGRAESRRALRAAEALALRIGASLRLVTAIDTGLAGVYLPQRLDELDEALGRHCGELQERAAAVLRRRGLEVATQLVLGAAGPGVVTCCEQGTDLLVTGSRGYGPLRSVLLGGASRHIVDHAPCPVLVLPRGASLAALTEPLALAEA